VLAFAVHFLFIPSEYQAMNELRGLVIPN